MGNFGNSKGATGARQSKATPKLPQRQSQNLPVVVVFPLLVCKAAYMVVVVGMTRDVDKRRVDGVNIRVVIEMR